MTMDDGPDSPASRADDEESVIGEYEVLDSALDQLDTLLDHLEQKNDDLFTKLQDLLESNKETRAERQTVHTETGDSTDRGTSDGTGRDTSDGSDEHRPAEH